MKRKRCAGCCQPKRLMVRANVRDQDAGVEVGLAWLCVPCLLTGALRVPRLAYERMPKAVREWLEVWAS